MSETRISAEKLAEYRAKAAAATKGPWREDGNSVLAEAVRWDRGAFVVAKVWSFRSIGAGNAAFIAAAREAVPALLDENAALRARTETLTRSADYWRGMFSEAWAQLHGRHAAEEIDRKHQAFLARAEVALALEEAHLEVIDANEARIAIRCDRCDDGEECQIAEHVAAEERFVKAANARFSAEQASLAARVRREQPHTGAGPDIDSDAYVVAADEPDPTDCVCAETSSRNCPVHQDPGPSHDLDENGDCKEWCLGCVAAGWQTPEPPPERKP